MSIDFEETGYKTCCFATEPELLAQYAGLGLTFGGGWEILNQTGDFGLGARSGEHFAAFNTEAGTTNVLTLSFASPVSDVSGYLGSLYGLNFLVEASSGSNVVASTNGSSLSGQYGGFVLGGLSGLNVNQVRITVSGYHYGVLDDLSFNTGASSGSGTGGSGTGGSGTGGSGSGTGGSGTSGGSGSTGGGTGTITGTVTAAPEPGAGTLLLLGAALIAFPRKRRR